MIAPLALILAQSLAARAGVCGNGRSIECDCGPGLALFEELLTKP